jgi:hypothetical protein
MYELPEIQRPEIAIMPAHTLRGHTFTTDTKIVICNSGDFVLGNILHLPNHVRFIYTTNCMIPPGQNIIGIPYGTLQPQADILASIELPSHKNKLVYCNFGKGSNKKRPKIWEHMTNTSFVTCEDSPPPGAHISSLPHYFEQLASSKFVICPPGNGPDTYRMWETLMVGSIPIVIQSSMIDHFIDDLPIVTVSHYLELTEKMLEEKYEQISNTTYTYNYLRKQYWIDRWLKDIED